jgi:hypothetical protein
MENLGIFYDHLVYFTAVGNILRPFGKFCGHLVIRFGTFCQEKSGNPAKYRPFHSPQWMLKFSPVSAKKVVYQEVFFPPHEDVVGLGESVVVEGVRVERFGLLAERNEFALKLKKRH